MVSGIVDLKITTLRPSQIRAPKSTACKSSEETYIVHEAMLAHAELRLTMHLAIFLNVNTEENSKFI